MPTKNWLVNVKGGELCDIGVGERTPSDFWQKEGRLCQKLENFQKAVWKPWKNCIFTFIVRDTWGRRTWREAGKENLPGILLQTTGSKIKTVMMVHPVFAQHFLNCTSSLEVICPGKNSPPSFLQYSSYAHWYLVFKFQVWVILFSKPGNSLVTELKRSCVLSFLFCQEGILIPCGSNT